MPRVTFNQYLAQRAFLRLAWEEFEQLYSLLTPNQQWDLHAYYQPITDDADDWLRAHRTHTHRKDPSLPARAGKSYHRMKRFHDRARQLSRRVEGNSQPSTPGTPVRAGGGPVSIRAVMRPEPDVHQLSMALISLARLRTDGRPTSIRRRPGR